VGASSLALSNAAPPIKSDGRLKLTGGDLQDLGLGRNTPVIVFPSLFIGLILGFGWMGFFWMGRHPPGPTPCTCNVWVNSLTHLKHVKGRRSQRFQHERGGGFGPFQLTAWGEKLARKNHHTRTLVFRAPRPSLVSNRHRPGISSGCSKPFGLAHSVKRPRVFLARNFAFFHSNMLERA